VFSQKRQEFLFVVELVMVFFLTADIVHHLRHVGLAHAVTGHDFSSAEKAL
jgi:hypothetical protein